MWFLSIKKEKKISEKTISLLPIFSKVFERIIYNSLFNHFISINFFAHLQSDFFLRDLCIAKLLHISKALDKVCHTGLPFKLMSSDVEGELLYLLECYFSNRTQRVVFNGQTCN